MRGCAVVRGMTQAPGRIGVFSFWPVLQSFGGPAIGELGAELEELGYGALWLAAAKADLSLAEPVLGATHNLVFATGIINIWTEPAADLVEAYRASPHRDRLLLGVGAGHPEGNSAQGYGTPLTATERYLDELEGIPRERLALAALGPKMLRLAAERTAGPHPYLVTPEHTASARNAIGAGPMLAVEQKVVLDTEPSSARETARGGVRNYLGLRNYAKNLRRLGFTDADFADGGSDRLVDALVGWGDEAAISRRVAEHLDAGASHVAVQVVTKDGDPRPGYRKLAPALRETAR